MQQNTRRDYDQRLAEIGKHVGDVSILNLSAADFTRWHRNFRQPGPGSAGKPRVRKAHGLMTMVRMLMSFGKSMRIAACKACVEVLEEMRFEAPKRRGSALTFEQASAIVDLALAAGRPSLALGQALQFELAMRQVDVIGKWERADSAAVAGGIFHKGSRWCGGLLWSDITPELTVSKITTKTAAEGKWDLNECPLVLKAIAAFPPDNRIGPVGLSEITRRPYSGDSYSRDWRTLADKAGVPRKVWNRDSRAGGITEGWDAGGAIQDLQRMATHSNSTTTQGYARNSLASSTRVAKLRVASRKQVGNVA